MNLFQSIPTDRFEKNKLIAETIDEITEGKIDPLKALATLKHLEDILKSIQKSPELLNAVDKEVDKYSKGEKIIACGYEISMSQRRNYDYSTCGDAFLEEKQNEALMIKSVIDERQKFLQNLKSPMFDAENGGFEIKPPMITFSTFPVLKEIKC